MTRQLLTPLAETLPASIPFVGPEAIERRLGRPLRARIGANESAFGPAQSVITAMQQAASGVWQYCDPELYDRVKQDLFNRIRAELNKKPSNP